MAGVIATVLSTERKKRNGAQVTDVKSDSGGEHILTPEHFSPAGDDSLPLPGDSLGGIPVQGSGRSIVSGYVDPINPGVAKPGEVRRYSRDDEGTVQATFHLRKDGSVEVQSVVGFASMVLGKDGSITGVNSQGSFTLDAQGGFKITNAGATLELGALGTFSLTNLFGTFLLGLSGDFSINGAQITNIGDIISALGKSLSFHTHPVTTAPGTTGSPT